MASTIALDPVKGNIAVVTGAAEVDLIVVTPAVACVLDERPALLATSTKWKATLCERALKIS